MNNPPESDNNELRPVNTHILMREKLESNKRHQVATKLGANFLNIDPAEVDCHGLRPEESAYLYGPVGHGKTQIAVALLLQATTISITTVSDLLLELRSSMNDSESSEKSIIQRYQKSRYLLIDDLGAEELKPYAFQMVVKIVGHRCDNDLPTLITSNMSLGELSEELGDRLASRIAQLCRNKTTLVKCKHGDRRVWMKEN